MTGDDNITSASAPRCVADWSAGFTLQARGADATLVRAQSLFRPKRLPARLMMPVIRRKFHQTQQAILVKLKEYAEN